MNTFHSAKTMEEELVPPRSKIYTGTGDDGTTSLPNNERCDKTSDIICAMGDVEELNALMGLAAKSSRQVRCVGNLNEEVGWVANIIESIQGKLMVIRMEIATPISAKTIFITESDIKNLERMIDTIDACVPPLSKVILPNGGESSCKYFVCRAVCRRAERSVFGLVKQGKVSSLVGVYLNRLGDLLHVTALYMGVFFLDLGSEWSPDDHLVKSQEAQ